MMKIFNKLVDSTVNYSIFHTLIVAVVGFISAVAALNNSFSGEFDLRFIGAVAMFLLVLSVVFTAFPFTLARVKAFQNVKNLSFDKKLRDKVSTTFMIVETIITVFLVLSYYAVMSGSIYGGVGLILLSLLNLVGLIVSAAVLVFGLSANKFKKESLKAKVNQLHFSPKVPETIIVDKLNIK